ncbi:MAG: ABC transporter permease [Bryobacteraceae bacterium]
MGHLMQDFRYGIRQLRRSPGFFSIAALLIAVGIAATTQIFTLVDAILLRPLPVRDPQNLVQLFVIHSKRPLDPYFDYRFYKQLSRESSTLFKTVGQIDTTRALERGEHAERIHAAAVTENFFSDLGVAPLLGRVLNRGDNHLIVLSYDYWSRGFARDPRVLGQSVRIQGHAYTIVGVTPREFTGTNMDSSPDLWMPFANQLDFARMPNPNLDNYVIEIIARLRLGVTERQAERETAVLWDRYMKSDPSIPALSSDRFEVQSIAHGVSPLREQSKTALLLLLAGTALLLLMVCANVGGLLLSRATARERETAVRIALGASRARILRQWLIESLILTVTGGIAGVVIASASLPLLMRWMPPAHGIGFDPGENRTLALHLTLDFRVLAFSFALCALTTLLCALAPAWRSSHSDINIALKSAMSDKRNRLFQSALCGFQIALCTTLLLSAVLIIRSLYNLRATDAGFDQDHVTIFSVDPRVRGYDGPKTWALEQRLVDGVKRFPGVDGAALAGRALMRGIGLGMSVVFPGQAGDGIVNTSTNSVSPDYFGVMGIQFLAGRNFSASENAEEGQFKRVVVNAAFVRKFLNGLNPLGQQFGTGRRFIKPQFEIIGVVSDTKYRSLREVPPPILYTYDFGPKAYPDTFILHVRSYGDPHAVIQPVRELLKSIDPEVPLYQVATLSEEVDRSLWQERLLVVLTSCFGAFALLLSAIGLYGILAYFVAQRRREIGLRMALGANSGHVIRLVAARIIPALALGAAAGLALSWFASAWVGSVLYGVKPYDPWSTSAALLLVFMVGIAGAMAPTFRAIRVDPSSTLRQE